MPHPFLTILMLQPPAILLTLQWSCSSLPAAVMYWEPLDWTHYASCGLMRAELNRIINLLDLPSVLLLIQSDALSLLPEFTTDSCSACPKPPMSFSAKQLTKPWELVHLRWRVLYLSWLNFMTFLLAQSSGKCKSLWMAGLISSISSTPSIKYNQSTDLAVLHPISFSKSFIKVSDQPDSKETPL